MDSALIRDIILFEMISSGADLSSVKYIAIDKDNSIMGYRIKPTLYETEWRYQDAYYGDDLREGEDLYINVGMLRLYYKKYGFDWKESLVKL